MYEIGKRFRMWLRLIYSLNGRFPPRVLKPLIDAGWQVGRIPERQSWYHSEADLE